MVRCIPTYVGFFPKQYCSSLIMLKIYTILLLNILLLNRYCRFVIKKNNEDYEITISLSVTVAVIHTWVMGQIKFI